MTTKRVVYMLQATLANYYENFEVHQEKINAWYEVLKECSAEKMHQNLITFAA